MYSLLKICIAICITVVFGDDNEWLNIKMPSKSYFMGFQTPNDSKRWKEAIDIAISGKNILLEKVMQQIPYPEEIMSGDTKFGWLQRISDLHVSNKRHPENELKYHKDSYDRAPIVLLGYRDFHDNQMAEGPVQGWHPIGAKELLDDIKSGKFTFPTKFVGIGAMDENWG